MIAQRKEKFGLMKTMMDAHTMGIYAAAELLVDCGYTVEIAPPEVERALETLQSEKSQLIILQWIREHEIRHIGVSYRLDPEDAVQILGRLVAVLKDNRYYESYEGIVKTIYFAGLKSACDEIDVEYQGRIATFRGGEDLDESLRIMGVPPENIPDKIISGCIYDKKLLEFSKKIIDKGEYKNQKALLKNMYESFGTHKDLLIKRLDYNFEGGFQPLIRAHSGPYSADMTREECLKQYMEWCHDLANEGFLDILSIGTSQLSQSNFGENWDRKINGGGVPVNSEKDFIDIWNAAKPMLVRTYSATKNIKQMAQMYEQTINIAWHALSLWWFDELDGRGPNTLYQNLREHVEAMQYIASVNKPIEANVSHHFAFRGCDDITYIVSAVLATKMAKLSGCRYFVLQNMLNTPRSTWGIQDLAKSRVMLKLIKELEDRDFRVIFQTRAGLDYFKPDLNAAKIQLAAVTMMMDDIDPYNTHNPEIIHVVSYSEALFLATPDIINDSIKITRKALADYRKQKRELGIIEEVADQIHARSENLEKSVRTIIRAMEQYIPDLYSPKGLYTAFVAGWLPVPALWSDSDEFVHAKNWHTKLHDGGIVLSEKKVLVTDDTRIDRGVSNIADAQYILRNKYGVDNI